MSAKPYYDAEHELCFMLANGGAVHAYGSTFTLPEERKFGTIENVQTYVNKVYEFMGRDNPPTVRARRGENQAHYQPFSHIIAVPEHRGSQHSWAMREVVILHEIAHSLTPAGHGPEWVGTFTDLVSRVVGEEAGFLLRAAMSKRGVQIGSSMV